MGTQRANKEIEHYQVIIVPGITLWNNRGKTKIIFEIIFDYFRACTLIAL